MQNSMLNQSHTFEGENRLFKYFLAEFQWDKVIALVDYVFLGSTMTISRRSFKGKMPVKVDKSLKTFPFGSLTDK